MTKITPPPVKQIVRLTEEQFNALRKQFPPSVVTGSSTPTMAAWQLGVAAVLEKLRDGFVV